MEWREEYKRKLMTAEEAVKTIKPGDRIVFGTHPDQPKLLGQALVARRDELKDVEINLQTPVGDPGWFRPESAGHFNPILEIYIGESARVSHDEKRSVYLPSLFSLQCTKTLGERQSEAKGVDVFMGVVSPPDKNGFCTFGFALWNKKRYARFAKKVIVEVDSNQIRTYGNNFIHVSEIDCFVEHTPHLITDSEIPKIIENVEPAERRANLKQVLEVMDPPMRSTWIQFLMDSTTEAIEAAPAFLGLTQPTEEGMTICRYAASLVKDGDCLQFGAGTLSGAMVRTGVLNDRHDLGIHSEMGSRGLSKLVKQGVVTGKRKNFHPGKIIVTALTGCGWEDFQFFSDNPLVELHDAEYVVNVRNVAANDNQVAMNNAIAIDLTGQINSETVFGGRMMNGTGGQPELHIGAVLSNGGRACTLLPSTGLGGAVSRIVPQFEQGTVVTIPRYFADYVITEYGIARLMGKTVRERASELIAIAHPDFRAELRKEAQKLFYP